MVSQELQAIVMAAGRGTRLPELTKDYPKCLLPIGPFPMLFYPLHLLQQHNFQDVIVIVLESQRFEIESALEQTSLKIKIDYITISNDRDFGTADSLRYIYERIKSDFIILPCDVITNVSLYPLINKFRQHNASMVSLLFNGDFDCGVTLPGPKTNHKPERDLIGLHPDTKRLLFIASTSDFEETISVNGHLMRKNSKMLIYSRLLDSHIYIMKKWLVDFLQKQDIFSTIKGEFVPYIVKQQMKKNTHTQLDAHSEFGVNVKSEDDIFNYISSASLEGQIRNASLYNDSKVKEPYMGDIIRCYTIEPIKESIGLRVNTTLSFFAANQKIGSIWPKLFSNNHGLKLISSQAVVNATQIKDIAAGENAKLSEKTSLNNSTFGPNSFVHPKNIITNSIILGHAIIEEGCNIDNSIICNHATIKRRSVLKNCIIGPNYVVEDGTQKSMVHLTNADGFMEIE